MILALLLLAGVILCVQPVAAQPSSVPNLGAPKKGPSGLPIPRFVSLKASEVNVRRGPSWDHAVMWVFRRVGLPVEVIAEFDVWRQVRDSEGATGWVLGTLLSGRRTVLVAPWKKMHGTFDLLSTNGRGHVEAKLSPGVLGTVENCDGKQCQITAGGVTGVISQDLLWGVYVGENIK
jgi:SH3-like domain-containing protein